MKKIILILAVVIASSVCKGQTLDSNFVKFICSDLSVLDTTINGINQVVYFNTIIPNYKQMNGKILLEKKSYLNGEELFFKGTPVITSIDLTREEFFELNIKPTLSPENIAIIRKKAISILK
jgi:hypothetical protein